MAVSNSEGWSREMGEAWDDKRMRRDGLVIGVDVGGTKIKAGVVSLGADGRPSTVLVAAEQIEAPRVEPAACYDTIAELIRRLRARVERDGIRVLPVVGVGHPGRFLPDGRLARYTTPNIGTSNAPGQFDGINPAEELRRRLGGDVRVFAENDAICQMRFGLAVLLHAPAVGPELLNQTIIYIGPGTGLGGGVARVSDHSEVVVVTDGHFFDLQLPHWDTGALTAEELFTGPAIARLVTDANRRLSRPIEPANAEQIGRLLGDDRALTEHRIEARCIADVQGDILAEIIRTIHEGRIVKVRLEPLPDGRLLRHVDDPDRAWAPADKALVRRVNRVILGGSVGINPVLGGYLRDRALEALRHHGLSDIHIFQIPVASADAGVLGAALVIPRQFFQPS